LRTHEEAQVGWVWTAVVVWVLLAAPAAVLLGRSIRSADDREFGSLNQPPRGRDAPSDLHDVGLLR
jgi:hypothetical protein